MRHKRVTRSRPVPTVMGNLKWGVKGGLSLGVFYSLWVGFLFLIGGPETFNHLGVSLTRLIAPMARSRALPDVDRVAEDVRVR